MPVALASNVLFVNVVVDVPVATVTKLKTPPEPLVCITWLAVPWAFGNVKITLLAKVLGALMAA